MTEFTLGCTVSCARVYVAGLCVAGCLVLCGASGCGTSDPVEGQDTPEETVRKMDAALIAGDKEEFRECFWDPEEAWAGALDACVEGYQVGWEFREALIAAYGPDAYDLYVQEGDEYAAIDLPDRGQSDIWEFTVRWLTEDAVVIDGQYYHREMRLVRKDGVWYALPSALFGGTPIGPDQTRRFIEGITAAHKAVLPGVANKAYDDIDEIKQRLWEEWKDTCEKILRGD